MEIYLIIVIVLFVLAISDLIVGVSNDAVNFLNSAVGAKVAPRHVIMIVASIGIFAGATFSSGLMEVARKGIFNPEMFLLPEIMVVFLAVMLTDVMLLDFYNTLGLPTSTTVSIVFELLGAAVAVSLIKIFNAGENFTALINYINTSKALAIISGILLSIAVAFTAGALFQFITRLIFTFDYEKKIKRYGAIWGGIALTSITFFILMKGIKGASFITPEMSESVKSNMTMILLVSILFWGIIFQVIITFTKINILKPIVLIGTFALGLAFAANDLVNFIGVPLAGLSSYLAALVSPNPEKLAMQALREPVQTSTIILLIAGIIMVVTLWFSKKARSVTKTQVDLSSQFEESERFESSSLSRILVRLNISLLGLIKKITPVPVQNFVIKRFDNTVVQHRHKKKKNIPAFDLLRASVNLIIASIIISFATSLKLPLSTTYVTFMVAMGISLSDRAWGTESAVYRVNGVLAVIGGWFFTALTAFTVSGILAVLIYYGELPIIILLFGAAGYFIYRTHILHKSKTDEELEIEQINSIEVTDGKTVIQNLLDETIKFLDLVSKSLNNAYDGLFNQDRQKLAKSKKTSKKLDKRASAIVSNTFNAVIQFNEDELMHDHSYGKVLASVQEISNNLNSITKSCFDHVDNNHKIPNKEQIEELKQLNKAISSQINCTNKVLSSKKFHDLKDLDKSVDNLQQTAKIFNKNQISRMKKGISGKKINLLYLKLFAENDNLSNHLKDLVYAWRDNFPVEKEEVKGLDSVKQK